MHFTQFTRAWNKKLQPEYRLKSFVSVDVRKSLGVKRNFIVSAKEIVYFLYSFLKAIKKNESMRWFLNRFAAFFFSWMFWLSVFMLSVEFVYRFLRLVMICLSFLWADEPYVDFSSNIKRWLCNQNKEKINASKKQKIPEKNKNHSRK